MLSFTPQVHLLLLFRSLGFRTLQIILKLLQLQVLLIPIRSLSPVKPCSGERFVHSMGSIGNLHLIQHLLLTQYHSFDVYVMCVHVQSVSMCQPVHSRTWCWMSTLIILHFIYIEVVSLPKLGTRWVQILLSCPENDLSFPLKCWDKRWLPHLPSFYMLVWTPVSKLGEQSLYPLSLYPASGPLWVFVSVLCLGFLRRSFCIALAGLELVM